MGYLFPGRLSSRARRAGPPRRDTNLFIVLNTGSGRGDAQALQDIIRRVLDQAGRRFQLMPVDDPSRLVATAREAVALAREAGGIVVAAGGDGTLNAVAGQVLGQGVPFGILPQGTFTSAAATASRRTPKPRCAACWAASCGLRRSACSTAACSWSMPAWACIRNCSKTAKPTNSASAAAAWWRCGPGS
ncbi:acylglycerol kinase family protein [Achromobacter xylosoxidans]